MFKQGPEWPQISTDKKSWHRIFRSMPELVSYFSLSNSLSFRQRAHQQLEKWFFCLGNGDFEDLG